ncbi:MAG: hypothetical protein WAN65_00370 [Candidatus Sulfotelmatobacter sp.]
MSWSMRGILIGLVVVGSVAMAMASTVSVDCNKGQSLNSTLAQLPKTTPATVVVNGTCTELVTVFGFENLTLQGQAGATVVEPAGVTATVLTAALLIESSRSVIVNGLNVTADTTSGAYAIAIGHGSSDIRLRNLTVQGGGEGIAVFEHSQVSIAYVKAMDAGYSPLGVYDQSDVHLERSSLLNSTGALHVGMDVGASHVTMYGTSISNMQIGINAYSESDIDLVQFETYYANNGANDVTISNASGTSYYGAQIYRSSLNVSTATLIISRAGQTSAGELGGILLSDGATMSSSSGFLMISNSVGQGIIAVNNSHATLSGATVKGGMHGGLLAVNQSSIDLTTGNALTQVSGNNVDLFCDATSMITGSINSMGVRTTQCVNLSPTEVGVLP